MRLLLLLLLIGSCQEDDDDMNRADLIAAAARRAVQKTPTTKAPEWGRSFTVPVGSVEQRSQLIRVQLPQPQDVTLYLQGLLIQTASFGAAQFSTNYSITVGCGGIALVSEDVWVPAVGRALHYTTDRIDVVGVVTESSAVAIAGTIRIAAAVSLGSPNISYRVGDVAYTLPFGVPNFQPPNNALTKAPLQLGWFPVASSYYQFVRVPAWASRVRMMWDLTGGVTPDQVNVHMFDGYGDVQPVALPLQHPTAPTTTLDQWAEWQVLDQAVSYIGFRSTVGGGVEVGRVLVQFEIYS
jgi:hypothetical protein